MCNPSRLTGFTSNALMGYSGGMGAKRGKQKNPRDKDLTSQYLRGAMAFHGGHFDAARAAWEHLLSRPAAERRFRSTWAAYMLGRMALWDADTDEAREVSKAFFKSASRVPMHRELGSQPYSPLIAVMTADYLLSARDLPGWPGVAPAIDFRVLLRKALAELQDGLFAHDRITRELSILYGIAAHQGLGDFFRQLVRSRSRNTRRPLEGNAISPRGLYVDGNRHGIENVLDAAYFAYYAHRLSSTLTIAALWQGLRNSIRYRLMSIERGPSFPDESDWIGAARADAVQAEGGDRTGG